MAKCRRLAVPGGSRAPQGTVREGRTLRVDDEALALVRRVSHIGRLRSGQEAARGETGGPKSVGRAWQPCQVGTAAVSLDREHTSRDEAPAWVHARQRQTQVTIPLDVLEGAGIRTGDRLRAEVRGPGEVVLIRDDDPVARFAGALTDVYPAGDLDAL